MAIFLMSTFKTFGQEGIKDDSFLTATGAICQRILAGLRWIWSYLYDKTSFKLTYGSSSGASDYSFWS